MRNAFHIHRQWMSAQNEPPEVAHTSAMLKIIVGDDAVTRNEDDWALTVRDEVRLSAYPLALWLASSWWRLRWEPLPVSLSVRSVRSWRMAHDLSAAGHGYVWPQIVFASDSENVNVWAVQSRRDSTSPIRYLASSHHFVGAKDFEFVIDEFIDGVIARLDAVGIERTGLHDLWSEIGEERADTSQYRYRRLEALLGFEPDEAHDDLINRFESLIPRAGLSAIDEVAAVCASDDPAQVLADVLSLVDSEGLRGRVALNRQQIASKAMLAAEGWQRGRELARRMRDFLGLSVEPIGNNNLCDILGLPAARALDVQNVRRPPLSIAVRENRSSEMKFLVRKRNVPGRRFELARFLGDYLIAERDDGWLPVTDAKTARQKTQRAFAAEFLCPIDALRQYLAGDFSTDAIDEAAEHFQVASRAVETQLVNNGLLPAEVLREDVGLPFFLA